jgi:predicted hydrolase (HD superfamily)
LADVHVGTEEGAEEEEEDEEETVVVGLVEEVDFELDGAAPPET